jgi:hypothetical protein
MSKASFDVYSRLELQKLPPLYINLIKANLLYYHTRYSSDYDKAREIFKGRGLRRLLKSGMPNLLMILAAYKFLVEGDIKEGRKLLRKSCKAAESLPNLGERLVINDCIKDLENILQEKGIDYAA